MFPIEQTWSALYTSLGPEIAISEMVRHTSAPALPYLNSYRLSELAIVELTPVLDCRDVAAIGLTLNDVWHPKDYEPTQAITAAAMARGCQGILVPSATCLGDNLIIFTDELHDLDHQIRLVGSRVPCLYVDRS